jgi:hypothetical protein
LPMICMPIGSPSSVRLTGIVVAGSPLSNAMPAYTLWSL